MIKTIDRRNYPVPPGSPEYHTELAWWATDDDRVLGTLLLDQLDHDYSYVVLMKPDGDVQFRAIDVGMSHKTARAATKKLHAAMKTFATMAMH